MLWVNLIMDTMGALALGTEPPSEELLWRRPYKRDASLISLPMWRNIFVQSTYQLVLLGWMLFEGAEFFTCEDGSKKHFSLIFNAFVFAQIFNEFNAREIGDVFDPLRRILSSPMFISVIVATVAGQYFIIEFGGDFTGTVGLTQDEWVMTAMLGVVSLPLGLFMRLIPVKESESTFAVPKKEGARALERQNLLEKLFNLAVVLGLMLLAFSTYEQHRLGMAFGIDGYKKVIGDLFTSALSHYNSIDNPDHDVAAGGAEEAAVGEGGHDEM